MVGDFSGGYFRTYLHTGGMYTSVGEGRPAIFTYNKVKPGQVPHLAHRLCAGKERERGRERVGGGLVGPREAGLGGMRDAWRTAADMTSAHSHSR